jgi:DHA1 family inner membrane transport protein
VLQQLQVLKLPRLLLVYAMTAVSYGGTFVAFTFLASILEQITGLNSGSVALMLWVYGVSVAVGNIWGGKLAHKKGPIAALQIIFGSLAMVLLAFTFTASNSWLAIATVLVWGALAFGNVPGLRVYAVQQTAQHAPHAIDVAPTLPKDAVISTH